MKKIIQFAVNNPVTVLMAVLGILLLGKISYDKLSVDLLPDLNNPKLFVELKAGERPPEEIEKQFVRNMESMAIRQRDVVMVSSVIRAGSARITVEYSWNKDMDEAFLDLQKAMNSYTSNEDITELLITGNDANTDPVILLSMTHKEITDMAELHKVADSYIRNELIRVDGVADVMISGDESSQLVINTDPYKLDAFGLSIATLSQQIEEENQRISGGRITESGTSYIVSGVNMLRTEEDFGNIIVGYKQTDAEGTASTGTQDQSMAPIYLKEVAEIHFENGTPDNIVRINGQRCIGLSVYKEMQQNTVKAVDGIIARLDEIQKALPGYEFHIISNQGTFINNSIGEVKDSAVLGIILAVIVLYLFLRRFKVTLVISMAIPISIVATFNLMFFGDLTLNIMTLGGLALGAGMLVDNAIVVIESIFRNQERGLSVKDAVIQGTSEVGSAVTASTLTTIVVFLPIVYLHGASGELFKDQAWTVTFSLVSSLFVAILVIPTLYARLFRKKEGEAIETVQKESVKIKGYETFLRNVLNRRWIVVCLSVLVIIGTVCLLPFIGAEFMPKADSNSFQIKVTMQEGTQLKRTAAAVENIEGLIYAITEDSLCTIYSHIGPSTGSDAAAFDGENTATMKVNLSSESDYTPEMLMEQLYVHTENIPGLTLAFQEDQSSLSSLMGSEEAPVIIEVKGEELDIISEITEEVTKRAYDIEGLEGVNNSIEDGAPEMILTVNRAIAAINEINVTTIVSQVQEQLSGRSAGQMEYKGEMRDIVVKVPEISLSDLNDMVITSGGQTFRLMELADVRQDVAPREIYRRNQSRIAKVTANLQEGYSLSQVSERIRTELSDIELPVNYSITVTGDEEKRQESMGSLMFALLLSVVLVYMVMASQFESLLHPFTILLTIPLALVGAIWLFFITDITINIMGVIGLIMLSGIAVNNSIILVDRINQLKEGGLPLMDAILEAAQQRIRPILMTSLTTILSLLPMAVAFGEGASLRTPMAIAVIGGLVTSTILSLIVIPCVYYLFEQMKTAFMSRLK